MQKKLARFIREHRGLPKRLISMLVPQPVLLNLGEFKMYVRLDDWAVGARIAVRRAYEEHVTRVIRTFLRPGVVVLDIGANVGYYTLLSAARISDTGKVIAFEPSSDNCALLRMSVRRNNFNNVVVHTKAVASKNGYVGFGGRDGSNGGVSLSINTSHPTQVEAVALDTFLQDESKIDLIKMDIEGAEGLALNGMKQLLQRHHPVILSEFSPDALRALSGISPEDYLNGLRALGYELRVISNGGVTNLPSQTNDEIMTIYAERGSDHLDLIAQPAV